MTYKPQLDGLRGLFVAAVFLCHAQFLACGWVGVQAFFVLSGYLITQVLLEAKSRNSGPRVFFKNFYARRALRIFPVYFVFIAAVVLLSWLGGTQMGEAIRSHSEEHAPYLLTYTYNFFRIGAGPGSPFYAHLWSLSIEEQFYLLWPLCVFLLSRRSLLGLCKILVVTGPLLRLLELAWISRFHPELAAHSGRVVYFLTMSYFDAFALGALLNFRSDDAMVERIANWSLSRVLLLLAFVSALVVAASASMHYKIELTAFGWDTYMQHFQMPIWGYSLLSLVFFLVIAKARPDSALVGNPLVQRLGKVSYGFYIFHLPLLWIAYQVSGAPRGTYTVFNIGVTAAAFMLTWCIAELSFRFMESPALAFKQRFKADGNSSLVETAQKRVAGDA